MASVSLIKDCDTQNKEALVLRLLNKALVCFYSQGTPCELIKMTDKDGINYGKSSCSLRFNVVVLFQSLLFLNTYSN